MAIIDIIRNIASDTAKNTVSNVVVFGNVVSSSPLIIEIDSGIRLTEDFIYITNNVCEYNVEVYVNTHGTCSGKTTNNKLKVGDSVVLLKCFGGQRFVVIGKCI